MLWILLELELFRDPALLALSTRSISALVLLILPILSLCKDFILRGAVLIVLAVV